MQFLQMTKKFLSFRPQQGLAIMNLNVNEVTTFEILECFRPQQGLTIMNQKQKKIDK